MSPEAVKGNLLNSTTSDSVGADGPGGPDGSPLTGEPIELEIFQLAECLASYSTLLDELGERLQLLGACQHGPVDLIEAATVDVIGLLERVETLDQRRRTTVQSIAEYLELDVDGLRLEDVIAAVVTTQALELTTQRWRLIASAGRVERESKHINLELGYALADLHEVERIAVGSPGTYNAAGSTGHGAIRRVRGVG